MTALAATTANGVFLMLDILNGDRQLAAPTAAVKVSLRQYSDIACSPDPKPDPKNGQAVPSSARLVFLQTG
jgi:hypothetical protein